MHAPILVTGRDEDAIRRKRAVRTDHEKLGKHPRTRTRKSYLLVHRYGTFGLWFADTRVKRMCQHRCVGIVYEIPSAEWPANHTVGNTHLGAEIRKETSLFEPRLEKRNSTRMTLQQGYQARPTGLRSCIG